MSIHTISKFSETYIKKFNLKPNTYEIKEPIIEKEIKEPVFTKSKDCESITIQTDVTDLIIDKLTRIEGFLEELKLDLQKSTPKKRSPKKAKTKTITSEEINNE